LRSAARRLREHGTAMLVLGENLILTKRPQWTFIIPALSGFESREAEEAALMLTDTMSC